MYARFIRRGFAILMMLLLLLCGCGQKGAQPVTTAAPTPTPDPAPAVDPVLDEPWEDSDASFAPSLAAAHPTNEPSGARDEIRVSDVDQFLAAIRPDTTVYLEPGDYDLTTAQNYGSDSASPYYEWVDANDGYGLQIHDVQGLCILGHSAATVTIHTLPRYVNVLTFADCSDISLKGVTAGHTEGAGYCSGAVVYLESVTGVTVTQCLLYGCGTLGVEAWNCKSTQILDCTVCDCSLGAVQLTGCCNTLMQDCLISGCGSSADLAYSIVLIAQSVCAAAVDCTMQDCYVQHILESAYSQDVQLLGCSVTGNTVAEAAIQAVQYSPVIAGCVFDGNQVQTWYADTAENGTAVKAVSQENIQLTEADLIAMQQSKIPYEQPTLPTAAASPVTVPKEQQVSSVDQLLAGIASNTTLYLEAGEYDLSTASSYGIPSDHYYWEDNSDGPGLVIRGVSNFHIIGDGADKVTISSVPRYADIIAYESCTNVSLKGVTLGHTEAAGSCTGGVLLFSETDQIAVEDCVLYGCGILGISAWQCKQIDVIRTEIYDCSNGAAHFNLCSEVTLQGCNIHDCGEPLLVAIDCQNATIDGAPIPAMTE